MDQMTHPLNEGHRVLGEDDYCSGYMDPFGKWNNGFPCPVLEENEPVFCCGTESLKYCCVNPKTPVLPPVPHLALLLGITFGIAVAVIVVITVSCFHCSCCLLYKKRQPTTGGSVYQMHCPSSSNSAGGVANMYSFSGTTTPTDTPRSVSRSRFTSESGPSTISYASYDLSDMRIRNDLQGHTYSRVHDNSRPGSIAFSDQSTSTLSDITVREMTNADRLRNSQGGNISLSNFEPPPPYTAAHSTLVAVRTSASNASTLPSYIPRPLTSPSLAQTLVPLTNQQAIQTPSINHTAIHNAQNSFQEPQFHSNVIGDTLIANAGSQLRTFSQSTMPSTASSTAAIAALTVATRLPLMKSNSQPNQPVLASQYNDQPLSITQNIYTNMRDGYSNRIYANSEAVFKNQLQNALANNLTPGFTNSQIRNKVNSQKYTLSQNVRAISNLTYDQSIPNTTCNPAINSLPKESQPRLIYTATKF